MVRSGVPVKRPQFHSIAVAILLLAGLAVRIGGAWVYRHDTSVDRCRVGIMAKHMAEGRDFPVFFYGGAYLGSFEPAVSAVFCRLLGPTGFALNLGTALLGFLLLPVAYLWAREAAGRHAGLVAMLVCLFGPFGYFYFLASPRGGYAATLLSMALVLWWTGRVAR